MCRPRYLIRTDCQINMYRSERQGPHALNGSATESAVPPFVRGIAPARQPALVKGWPL